MGRRRGRPTTSRTCVGAVDGFGGPLVLVSPEVGLSVVPATESGRRFADELGMVNQRLAAQCDRVVLVVAGQPLTVKETLVTDFPDIAAPDAHGRGRRAGPSGDAHQAVGRARPARGPVGMGVRLPGNVPAAAIRTAAGGGLRRRSRRDRGRGLGVPVRGDRTDGGELRRGRGGDQRARRVGRCECPGGRRGGRLGCRRTSTGAHKVRRGSGNIAVEDALTDEETVAAVEAGRRVADEEVDAGADLLIAGDMGIGNTTAATTLIAALTDSEPVAVVGRGTGVDDAGWARKTAAIRDALYRARAIRSDPLALLRVCGGADLAAMAGFLAQAAVRRTPVLLDGVVVTAAALVADRLAPGARAVVAGGSPVHRARARAGAATPGSSSRSSISRCASARAPARPSRCRSCGPRWRRWPRWRRSARPR